MDAADVSTFVRSVVNDDLAVVATLTFFVCEALFNALPDFKDRLKQLTALIIGGVLGAVLIQNDPLYSVIHGLLAGGAATTVVARFKAPSKKMAYVDSAPSNPATPITPSYTPSTSVQPAAPAPTAPIQPRPISPAPRVMIADTGETVDIAHI